jgi:hypothetical protein
MHVDLFWTSINKYEKNPFHFRLMFSCTVREDCFFIKLTSRRIRHQVRMKVCQVRQTRRTRKQIVF